MTTLIKIIPGFKDGNRIQMSQGTRVMAGNQELNGIMAIDVRYVHDQPVTAALHVYVTQEEVNAIATFVAVDPETGENRAFKRIEWADGGFFEC